MRIYFAHCKNDYGKEPERKALRWFMAKGWLDHIVNPSDPKWQQTCVHNQMDYWFGVVRNCTVLYFLRYKNRITCGVGGEIEIAIKEGMFVNELVPNCTGFDVIPHEKVPEFLDLEATRRLMYPEKYVGVAN